MRRIGGPEIDRYILVDGNNLLRRSYYVFIENRLKEGTPLLSGQNGFSTGVIYGFLSFLNSWLYDMQPFKSVAVVFDGRPSRRRLLDPTYKIKSNDDKTYDFRINKTESKIKLFDGFEAISDISALIHILKLLGCDIYHDPNEEADDIIATLCKKRQESIRIIVSDDKDFFQLLTDPKVILYRPGAKNRKFCDAEESMEVWGRMSKVKGVGTHPKVPCSQVRMFKTLCGDSSDEISGVPRLRKHVAMSVCHFSSLDEIYSSGLTKFSKSEKLKMMSMRERLKLNWELIGLKDDVDLSNSLQQAQKNYQMAVDICKNDLFINLDLNSFKPAEMMNNYKSIPLDDWLAGI